VLAGQFGVARFIGLFLAQQAVSGQDIAPIVGHSAAVQPLA